MKTEVLTYELFLDLYYNQVLPNKYVHFRNGQCLLLLLKVLWKKEYERIRNDPSNREIDCYYREKFIPNTLNHLKKRWHLYPN